MEDIAARAGVSVGTLYNYFGDRDRLIQTLLGVRGDDLLVELDAVMVEHALSGFALQLGAFLTALFQHFERHRRLFTRLLDGSDGGPPRPGRKELKRQLFERIGRLTTRGVEAGELDPTAAETYPALLMGMAHGAIAHAMFDSSASPLGVDARVSACVRVFLDGARGS
jgi:AcrR family transcriptional regulator